MRKSLLALALLSALVCTACGEDPLDKAIKERGAGGGGGNATGPARTATLKGTIKFDGMPPKPKPISTSSDPACKNPSLTSEEVVVSDGGLENVIVYISGGDIANMKFPPSKDQVVLSQMGCHYIPHALTVQVGQQLKIVNNDETAHNIHAWAMINMPFNESQSTKGVENVHTFDKEEVLLPVRCDVHNWMNAFIGVFNHPLSAVSGKGGAYEIKLPPGSYTVTAEHETLGKQDMMVMVAENGTAELNFTFKGK